MSFYEPQPAVIDGRFSSARTVLFFASLAHAPSYMFGVKFGL
jgi:hypothetical protein